MRQALSIFSTIDDYLNPIFSRLPSLPPKTKQTIITHLPFIALIIGIINTLQGLISVVFKVLRVLFSSPDLLDGRILTNTTVDLLTGLLLVMSYSLLKKNYTNGWQFIFGATLIIGILNIMSSQFGLISTLLFLYVLYQVKNHYHS